MVYRQESLDFWTPETVSLFLTDAIDMRQRYWKFRQSFLVCAIVYAIASSSGTAGVDGSEGQLRSLGGGKWPGPGGSLCGWEVRSVSAGGCVVNWGHFLTSHYHLHWAINNNNNNHYNNSDNNCDNDNNNSNNNKEEEVVSEKKRATTQNAD